MTEEIWKVVPGTKRRYEISNLGRVKSVARLVYQKNGRMRQTTDRIMKTYPATKQGYQKVRLFPGGMRFVHLLVLEVFVGPRPPRAEACHNNGDPNDNRLTNLRWDSRHSNHADMRKHGTSPQGERCNLSKLTAEQVTVIRYKYQQGNATQKALADTFGVSSSTVSRIITRDTWFHLP